MTAPLRPSEPNVVNVALGARAYFDLSALPAETGTGADYDRLRISLGVPDGSRDLPVEKAILLENGFDELNAIDWDKGCYLGQELTARTRYRGLVRKRLMPVAAQRFGILELLGQGAAGFVKVADGGA